ncbi:hypothetical protein V8E36_000335 [Tilletia maclaganii]
MASVDVYRDENHNPNTLAPVPSPPSSWAPRFTSAAAGGRRSPLGPLLARSASTSDALLSHCQDDASKLPFPAAASAVAASPHSRLRPHTAHTSPSPSIAAQAASPARSQASSTASSSRLSTGRSSPSNPQRPGSELSFSRQMARNSLFGHAGGEAISHPARCTQRSGSSSSSSAFSISSSSYSASYTHEPRTAAETSSTPTVDLNLSALAAMSDLAPGVAPAFLVVSVINHILFTRGALDAPLKLEPLLHGVPTSSAAEAGSRTRAQSLGSSQILGTSKVRSKQHKLQAAILRLHADLLTAVNTIYQHSATSDPEADNRTTTCDADISVLLSFGASPLLPKEYVHIVLRLSGVPLPQDVSEPQPQPSAEWPDLETSASSGGVLSTARIQAPPSATTQIRAVTKTLTALQRKVLRFIVSEEDFQTEAFRRRLASRLHVLLNVRYLEHTATLSPTQPLSTVTPGEATVTGAATYFPLQTASQSPAVLPPSRHISLAPEAAHIDVPRSWSVRRNAKVPPEVTRLQQQMSGTDVPNQQQPPTSSSHWTSSPMHALSRSSSPCPTTTTTSGSHSALDDFSTCASGLSSRLGSVLPSFPPTSEEHLPTLSANLAGLDDERRQCGGPEREARLAGAAARAVVAGLADLTGSASQGSVGSSTPTPLPFAPSLLRPEGAADGSGSQAPPVQAGWSRTTRPAPKSRLRGGFVLLRKTTSATFPPPSSELGGDGLGSIRAARRGPGPRLSGASSLSFSLSESGSADNRSAAVRQSSLSGAESSLSSCADAGPSRTTSKLSSSSFSSLAPTASRAMNPGGGGLRPGSKKVLVVSMVLDMRTQGEDRSGEAMAQERGRARESTVGPSDKDEGPHWWICDTVLPLGR